MVDRTKRKQISASCPCCLGRIGPVAGLRSPSPFSVRCPHCKTKLAVRMPGQLRLVAAVSVVLIPLIGAIQPIHAMFGTFWTLLYAALLLVFGVVLDFGMSVLYFTHGRLIPTNRLKGAERTKEIL